MSDEQQQQQPGPGFFQRLILAFVASFAVLFNPAFAAGVLRLRQGGPSAPPAQLPAASPVTPPALAAPPAAPPLPKEALHMLALLQREGRLIDFLQEPISGFTDAEVGAAARAVHEGCSRVLQSYLELAPVFGEEEGAFVTLPVGFDPARVRLTGNVVGDPPFTGALRHHGWRAEQVRLPAPPASGDARILAPAEVELP